MLPTNRQFVLYKITRDLSGLFLRSGGTKYGGFSNSDFMVCEVARPAKGTTLSDNSHLVSKYSAQNVTPRWAQNVANAVIA